MTAWYLCEACGDVADSLSELGFCYTLGDESLQKQIADYRSDEAAFSRSLKVMKTPKIELTGTRLRVSERSDVE